MTRSDLRAQSPGPGVWAVPFNHPYPGLGCGQGGPPASFNPLHACLIPKGPNQGKVLVWDRSGDANCTQANGNHDQRWAIVDPENARVDHVAVFTVQPGWVSNSQHGNHNLFCSGHAWMPDGRLLVVGGDNWEPTDGGGGTSGSTIVMIYDPALGPWGTWMPITQFNFESLAHPRWYPTPTLIAKPGAQQSDLLMLVFGGVEQLCVNDPPDQAKNTYEVRLVPSGAPDFSPPGVYNGPTSTTHALALFLYPRAPMVSERALGGTAGSGVGRVFTGGFDIESAHVEHFNNPGIWPQPHAAQQNFMSTSNIVRRDEAGCVLFPNLDANCRDQLMVLGGEGAEDDPCLLHYLGVRKDVQLLDTKSATPQWDATAIPDMKLYRKFPNPVLLPDGSVAVFGGSADGGYPGLVPQLQPEIFKNGQWWLCAAEDSPRTYHSNALLLPSGKVQTAGGDTRTWDYGVYSPQYLTITPRPQWGPGTPTTLSYDTEYGLPYTNVPFGVTIDVALLSPGAMTHSMDSNLRYVKLDHSELQAPGEVGVVTPLNETYAPPGYYMMFMAASNGAVSEAKWVTLQ